METAARGAAYGGVRSSISAYVSITRIKVFYLPAGPGPHGVERPAEHAPGAGRGRSRRIHVHNLLYSVRKRRLVTLRNDTFRGRKPARGGGNQDIYRIPGTPETEIAA